MPNQQATHIDFASGVAAPAASFAIVRKVSIMTRQEIRSALRKVSNINLLWHNERLLILGRNVI